jgi:putative cobalt transporter subunit CbtA
MVRALLVRGMLAGFLAGILAVGFAEIFGEPQIDHAIAFEAAMDQRAGIAPEPELVSRAVQKTAGLLTAVLAYGVAFGGLFSLVFAFTYGRIGPIGPRALAALLVVAGFVGIVLVPVLKYPPAPPAVGLTETIGIRTALYFEMIVISLAALTLAVLIGRSLIGRLSDWSAGVIGAAAFIGFVATVQLALPDINEVPEHFPAAVLWRFRVGALGMQLVFWGTLGLVFGALAERSVTSRSSRYRAASRVETVTPGRAR